MITLTAGVVQPSLLVLFILLGFDVVGILLALVISHALTCVLSWVVGLRSLPAAGPGEDGGEAGLFAGTPGLAGRLFRYVGLVYALDLSKYLRTLPFASLMVLGFFEGSREEALGHVALLGVGYKVVDLAIKFLVSATRGIYTPMLAEVYATRDTDKLRRVFTTISKLQILLCVPAAFGLYTLSREFIVVLFGSQFEPAVALTRVLEVVPILRTAQRPN